MNKALNIIFFFSLVLVGFLIYFLFLKSSISHIFCKKQIDIKFTNFQKAIKQNGASVKTEVNENVKKFLAEMYNECLKNEGLK